MKLFLFVWTHFKVSVLFPKLEAEVPGSFGLAGDHVPLPERLVDPVEDLVAGAGRDPDGEETGVLPTGVGLLEVFICKTQKVIKIETHGLSHISIKLNYYLFAQVIASFNQLSPQQAQSLAYLL